MLVGQWVFDGKLSFPCVRSQNLLRPIYHNMHWSWIKKHTQLGIPVFFWKKLFLLVVRCKWFISNGDLFIKCFVIFFIFQWSSKMFYIQARFNINGVCWISLITSWNCIRIRFSFQKWNLTQIMFIYLIRTFNWNLFKINESSSLCFKFITSTLSTLSNFSNFSLGIVSEEASENKAVLPNLSKQKGSSSILGVSSFFKFSKFTTKKYCLNSHKSPHGVFYLSFKPTFFSVAKEEGLSGIKSDFKRGRSIIFTFRK